jgi:hypothetical protein
MARKMRRCKGSTSGSVVLASGPNLLGGTNIVLAVNSFVANDICSGNTYSYQVDTGRGAGMDHGDRRGARSQPVTARVDPPRPT